MKRILFLATFLSFSFAYSQVDTKWREIEKVGQGKLTLSSSTSNPNFIKFSKSQNLQLVGSTEREKAEDFINKYFDALGLDKATDIVFNSEFTDNYGFQHVIFQQTYKGVPVFDGVLKFNFDAEKNLTSINGNIISVRKLSAVPVLSFADAEGVARSLVKEQNLNESGIPLEVVKENLLVFPKGLVQGVNIVPYLVYEVELTNKNDVRESFYINAHTGELVEQFTGIHPIDRKLYETSISTNNLRWSEGDPLPGQLNIWQQNEVIVAGHVYNFFKNAFGYVSYNGNDRSMITINNNPNISCPNANWNGTSANYCNGTAADDVVAHEWGHAYTSYTSGLIYQYQSGALNESYSDVWGETIDLLNGYQDDGEDLSVRTNMNCNSSSTRWKMGEDATAFGTHIRDMWNPNCRNNPSSVLDSIYYHCASSDAGGVHRNSGVTNHLYALVVDGGTFNGYTIQPMGFVKAAHIWWRAQRNYLTSTSNFAVFADALEAACTDLIGINLQGLSTSETPAGPSGQIITAADLANLQNAILAVELRESVNAQCNFFPVLQPTPEICTGVTTGGAIFAENWENGIGNWVVSNLPSHTSWINRNWNIRASLPAGRTGRAIYAPGTAIGNCSTSLQNGIVRLESPTITIPNYISGKYEMAFNHYVATEALWDGGNVKYSLDGGAWTIVPMSAFIQNPYNNTLDGTSQNDNPMKGQPAWTGIDGGSLTGSWGQSVIDLSLLGAQSGSTIKFRFEFGTDGCNGNDGWYIDEIYVYNCNNLLSTEEITKDSGISVYPNPTSGMLFIENTKASHLKYGELFNAAGQLVKSIELNQANSGKQSVNLGHLPSGTYMLKIYTDKGASTVKVIKQ